MKRRWFLAALGAVPFFRRWTLVDPTTVPASGAPSMDAYAEWKASHPPVTADEFWAIRHNPPPDFFASPPMSDELRRVIWTEVEKIRLAQAQLNVPRFWIEKPSRLS